MKALIVEDDPFLRRLWRTLLEDRGAKVVDVDSTGAVVSSEVVGQYDLVVLDIYVGAKDTVLLAAELARKDPDCALVVAAGSGWLEAGVIASAIPDTAVVLRKPVDIDDFIGAVDGATRSHSDKARATQQAS